MLLLAAWAPLAAQRPRVRVGYGGPLNPKDHPRAQLRVDAFRAEMTRLGWREGLDITYLFRFVDDSTERCTAIAREFVAERVDLIVATYNMMAGCSLAATSSIPIAAYTADAIELGYIKSLARPGGNLTGVVESSEALAAKRLQLLCQAAPRARRVAYLTAYDDFVKDLRVAAGVLRVELVPIVAEKPEQVAPAIAGAKDVDAWLVDEDVAWGTGANQLFEWIAASGKPAMYSAVEFPRSGALMAYGYDRIEGARDVARFADRILRGAKPADLPAEQPTRFAFVFNARTARALGFQLPRSVFLQVTEVID